VVCAEAGGEGAEVAGGAEGNVKVVGMRSGLGGLAVLDAGGMEGIAGLWWMGAAAGVEATGTGGDGEWGVEEEGDFEGEEKVTGVAEEVREAEVGE
jgi:hypothetical protein